jgi:thiamine pyrophosphokinase
LRALIVADGDIPSDAALEQLELHGGQREADPWLIVAADGGALKAERLGLRPDVVVGDADSLEQADVDRLRSQGVEVTIYPAAKNESDTELAVREALGRGATRLVIVGATGGPRLEHTVANLLLLGLPELAALDVSLIDGSSTLRVIGTGDAGELTFDGSVGDYVSLLPFSETVEGVTTDGLLYALTGETLWQGQTRGLSNELASTTAAVRTRSGRLAVIHTTRARAASDD